MSALHLLGGSDVRRLLAEAGVRPSKHRGQNFLADPNTARRIVALAAVEPGQRVLEVGAGLGSLTVALVEAGADVLAVEVDDRLAAVARRVAGDRADVRLQDATTADWPALLGPTPGTWRMVSNLPYSVGTHVLVDLLDGVPQIGDFLVMVQREVGERLVASPGTAAYGALSVKVAYRCEVRLAGRVPAGVFVPRPEVDSVLVALARRSAPPVTVAEGKLFGVVETGFAQRRKTLRAALSSRWDRAEVEAALEAAGVDPTRRAETLSLPEFAAVAAALA